MNMKPIVKRRIRRANKVREGRGYSLAELGEAGLDLFTALRRGLSIDRFRKSKHAENVERLRKLLERGAGS